MSHIGEYGTVPIADQRILSAVLGGLEENPLLYLEQQAVLL